MFTVTASPAPTTNLHVKVAITTAGDYGAATGQQTVTIPTSGSVILTVNTTGDLTDEPNGSVTATLNTGNGYTISNTNWFSNRDHVTDDDPTRRSQKSASRPATMSPKAPPRSSPVTASPAPTTNLHVKVTITAAGDYGAATGQRTVTITYIGTTLVNPHNQLLSGTLTDEPRRFGYRHCEHW